MISVKFFGMHGLRMLVAGASSRRLQLVSEACVVGHGCLLGGALLRRFQLVPMPCVDWA